MISLRITEAELAAIYLALNVDGMVAGGQLVSSREDTPQVPATLCEGGTSYYTRLANGHGTRVARIHHVDCPDAETLSWVSALRVGDVTLYRTGHDRVD